MLKIQNDKKISYWFYLLFTAGLAIVLMTNAARAQTLYLESNKTSYNIGDSFLISLILDTSDKAINAVNGAVLIPPDKFQIVDLRFGNSVIPIWVERPAVDYLKGIITFVGGIPGGFNGSSGQILSFTLKAKETGQTEVSLQNIKVLLNDGKGTELKNMNIKTLALKINEAGSSAESSIGARDVIAPENFIPIISRDKNMENNKYFVSFFAIDKDTGISYYEIKEKPVILSLITPAFDTAWKKAESPYILSGQLWAYNVIVRACDGAQNCTDGVIFKPFSAVMVAIFTVILLGLVIFIIYLFLRTRRGNKKLI